MTRDDHSPAAVGFLGLGVMGQPMALNLARAGTPLVVWNRSVDRTRVIAEAGAIAVPAATDVLRQARVVILMLKDEAAIDATLRRGSASFTGHVTDRTIVHMGTTSPDHSRQLGQDIRAAGGRYVEAPVSGSRGPAEAGELIAMMAGEPDDVSDVRPLLHPMCRGSFDCGPVPNGLLMKLAVNTFLIAMVTGLTEAYHLADRFGLDQRLFADIVAAGPMASRVSSRKADKLVGGDFDVEASMVNVLENSRLVVEAARERHLGTPLLDVCHALYLEAVGSGFGGQDMVAVLRAVEARDSFVEARTARSLDSESWIPTPPVTPQARDGYRVRTTPRC